MVGNACGAMEGSHGSKSHVGVGAITIASLPPHDSTGG